MYQERMFDTWQEGILHLVIVIAIPIIPIIIYMITKGTSDTYLYVLLLTVIISFIYEFFHRPSNKCSRFLKVESIICTSTLAIMFVWALFMLTYASDNEREDISIKASDFVLISLFLVPIFITVIEIVRCIIIDFKSSDFQPQENNLVKGASGV